MKLLHSNNPNASNELMCKTLFYTLYLSNMVYTAEIHLEYEMVQPYWWILNLE